MYPYIYFGTGSISVYHLFSAAAILSSLILLYLNASPLLRARRLSATLYGIALILLFIPASKAGTLLESLVTGSQGDYNSFFSVPSSFLWGALITASLAFPIARLLKIRVSAAAPYLTPSLCLGGFFLRLGCLFYGCCFGTPALPNFPLATFFAENTPAGNVYHSEPLIPVQLYEAAFWLTAFVITEARLLLSKTRSSLGLLYTLGAYSIFRFFMEFGRYHPANEVRIANQVISLLSLLIIIILIFKRSKTSQEN